MFKLFDREKVFIKIYKKKIENVSKISLKYFFKSYLVHI